MSNHRARNTEKFPCFFWCYHIDDAQAVILLFLSFHIDDVHMPTIICHNTRDSLRSRSPCSLIPRAFEGVNTPSDSVEVVDSESE